MTTSRSWLAVVALFAVAVAGAVLWILEPERRLGVEPAHVAREKSLVTSADVGGAAGPDDGREQVVRAAALAPSGEAVLATSEIGEQDAETWTLRGTLLRASDGTPAAALHVAFREDLSTESDARGRFDLELPVSSHPRGSRTQVAVKHGSGTILLQEECVLEPGLELRIDDEIVWLHGRVVDASGAPLVHDGVALSCWLADGSGRHLGSQAAPNADGGFQVAAKRAGLSCDSVTVRVDLRRTLFPSTATLESLRSEEGATVVLDVCPLRIELRATDGGQLVDPDLRFVAWRPGAEQAEVLSFPVLDASLDVELFVERNVERIELAAGAQGCAPRVEEHQAPRCGQTLRVELVRMGPDDVLAGVVLDAGGRPVEHAFASCSPPARDDQWVAVPAIRGVRTDAEGRFSLPFARFETARVMAYHVDHGSTGEELVQGGRRDLVLRFRPFARLDVAVTMPDGEPPGNEPVSFALGLADGTWTFDLGYHGRVLLEEVPAGSHTLLCLSHDERWWLSSTVEVFDIGPQQVLRTLAPTNWVEGALIDGTGKPLAGIEVWKPSAPLAQGAEWNPFLAVSDADGRFRVLLGSDAEGELAFARDGIELGRKLFAPGNAGSVRLDAPD